MKEVKIKYNALLKDGKTYIKSELFPFIAQMLDDENIKYLAFDITENTTLLELDIKESPTQNLVNLEDVCKFIQRMDRNSDIMDFYNEVVNGESDKDSLIECVTRILNEWKSDADYVVSHGKTIKDRAEAFREFSHYDYLLKTLEENKNE